MYEKITGALLPVINENGMTASRLMHLIHMRDFIDRISSNNYINDEALRNIEKKFGVYPDIITWGDFFQAELATTLRNASDEEFFTAFETVKFDMISSYMIFNGKGPEFFEWLENSSSWLAAKEEAEYTEEDKEIRHLRILMDYYLELGINGSFTDAELKWHSSFNQAMAI